MKKEPQRSSKTEREKLLAKNHILKRWLAISVLFSGGLLALEPIDDKIVEKEVRKQYETLYAGYYNPPYTEPNKDKEYEETLYDTHIREENKRYPYTFKELEEKAGFNDTEYFEDAMLVHKIDERSKQVEFVRSEEHNHYKVVAFIGDIDFYGLKEGTLVKVKGDLKYAHQQGNWNYLQITPEDFAFYPDDSSTVPPWKGKEEDI